MAEKGYFTNPHVRGLFRFLSQKWVGGEFKISFVSRRYFSSKVKSSKGKIIVPFDVTPGEMDEILSKVEGDSLKKNESPQNQLADFLFRKGRKLLAKNMPFDTLPEYIKNSMLHWKKGQTTLFEALRLDFRLNELEEVRATGDVRLIADKEREIADKIQLVVSSFPFLSGSQQIVDLVESGMFNCRGASVLGGALFSELGINYLVGDVPKHSILFLLARDDTIEWRDMLAPQYNEILRAEMFDGDKITFSDIERFAKKPTSDGLMVDVVGDGYREKMSWVKKGQRQFVTFFPPVEGSQMQLLHGIAYHLVSLGWGEGDTKKRREYFLQAIEACKLSAMYNPQYEYAHNKMGEVYCFLGEHEKAIPAFQKAMEINPRNSFCYYGLGTAFYGLGCKKEALEKYSQYLALADPETSSGWIAISERRMKELSREGESLS